MTEPIAFTRAVAVGGELANMQAAMETGHTSSGGPFSDRAAEQLRVATGGHDVLLTTSCSTALELSAMLLDLQPGDTVIVPSYTFTSSALAFAREGARILFCDIEPDTLGPDPASVAELLDDSVRAVVVVHYAGVAGDLDGLRAVLAGRPDIAVIEDNAHGLFGRWRGQPLGSLSRFATQSFHDTKNIVCGEGGALILNDEADAARAWVLYEKGTDRRAFFQGMVDKYSWRDTGSSFALAEILAGYLVAQLDQAAAIQARRQAIYQQYATGLGPYADALGVRLPSVPEHCDPAYHLFHLVMPDHESRTRVMTEMKEDGIQTTFHYVPLHSAPAGLAFAARETPCPTSTDISTRLLRLPFHNALTDSDIDRVLDSFVRAAR